MKKKFLFILFSVCFLFVGGSFLSACGEDPDAFVPYLEMTQGYGFEDVEVDTETKTISYTTKGKYSAKTFDSKKIKITLYDTETTSIVLQYTENEVVEEGQYALSMAEGIDFNLPGTYAVTIKTAYFGEQTYTVVCNKKEVAVPTFFEWSGEFDGRFGVEYTGYAINVMRYLRDYDYDDGKVWTVDTDKNLIEGEIGARRTETGSYKVHVAMKEESKPYYVTSTGATEAYIDWAIKRRLIITPNVASETYYGNKFSKPRYGDVLSLETGDIHPDYHPDWFVYLGVEQDGEFVEQEVRNAGEYEIGITIPEDKLKNHCFWMPNETGKYVETEVCVRTWTIKPQMFYFHNVTINYADKSSVVYAGHDYDVSFKYGIVPGESAVSYAYDKERDSEIEIVGGGSGCDAGDYQLLLTPTSSNYAIAYYRKGYKEWVYSYYGDAPLAFDWKIHKKQVSVPSKIYSGEYVTASSEEYENGTHLTYTGEVVSPEVCFYDSDVLEAKFEDSILYSENPYKFSIGFRQSALKNYVWSDGTQENKGEYTYYIDQREVNVEPFLRSFEKDYVIDYSYPETKVSLYFDWIPDDFAELVNIGYENNVQANVGDYTAKVKLSYKNDSKESLKFYKTDYVDGEEIKIYLDIDDEYEIDYTIEKESIFNDNSIPYSYKWDRVSTTRFGFGRYRANINGQYYGTRQSYKDRYGNMPVENCVEVYYDLYWDVNGEWEKADNMKNYECNYKIVGKEVRYYYNETDWINPYENENFNMEVNVVGKELVYNLTDHPIDIELNSINYQRMDDYSYSNNKMRYGKYYDIVYDGYNNYHSTFMPQITYYQEFEDNYYGAPKTLKVKNWGNGTSVAKVGFDYEYFDENMNKLDAAPTKVGKYYQKATFHCPEGYFVMNGIDPILYEFNIIKTPVGEVPISLQLSWNNEITWDQIDNFKEALNVKYNYNHPYIYLDDILLAQRYYGAAYQVYPIDKITKTGRYYFIPVWKVKEEYADEYCVGINIVPSSFFDPASLTFIVEKAQLNHLDYGDPVFGNEGNAYEFTYDGTVRTIEDFVDHFELTDTSGNFFTNRYLISYVEDDWGVRVDEICNVGEYCLRFYVALEEEYYQYYYFLSEGGGKSQGYNWFIDITIKPASALVSDCSIEGEQTIVYDGENHIPVVKCKGQVTDVDYTLTDAKGNVVTEAVDVGTYTFKVNQLKGNYKIEGDFDLQTTFEITHKTYDLSKLEWNYSGELDYSGEEVEIKLVDELGLEFDYAGNVATDAGDYVATATVKPSYLENANIIFTGEIESLSWKINKQDVNVATLEWNYATSFVYDGTEKVVTIKNIYNLEIAYSENAKTDVGEYVATATIISTENANKNFNYIGTSFSLNWKILPQQVVFEDCVWDYQEEFVYDSTEKTVKLIGSYEFDYVDNAKTDAGQYTATATMIDERIGNKNYIIVGKTSYTISWTIEKVKIQIDDIEWNHPMALTYTGETYEFLPTNLPEFATYTISGNVATEPGNACVVLTTTNKNVVYCMGQAEFESVQNIFYIQKVGIDISGIQLKERFVEWYEGIVYQPEIDQSTVPENILCEISSVPEEWWEGNCSVGISIWVEDSEHYFIKDSYDNFQTLVYRYVKMHGPIEALFTDWGANTERVQNGVYPTNKFMRRDSGVTFWLQGNVEMYTDKVIITYTDKDGNVFNMDETPITELGFYTLHAELVSPLDLSGVEIEDFVVEIVKGRYEGEPKFYYVKDSQKVYIESGNLNISYTGQEIEIFAEFEDGIDFEMTFEEGPLVKDVGEYNLWVHIKITDEDYIEEDRTELLWFYIVYAPVKQASYGSGAFDEHCMPLDYDLYYGFDWEVNRISSNSWWAIELNEGYSIYIDGRLQTPNSEGVYVIYALDYNDSSSTRYVTVLLEVKYGDVVITEENISIDTYFVVPGPGFDF